jgi:hypothetical protein
VAVLPKKDAESISKDNCPQQTAVNGDIYILWVPDSYPQMGEERELTVCEPHNTR